MANIITREDHNYKHLDISEIELSWMAGFFDGEGSLMLGVHKFDDGRCHFNRRACVVNTVVSSLEIYKKYFGGSLSERKSFRNKEKFKNCKPIYSWQVYSKQSVDFVKSIYPYLKLKKKQADVFLDYNYWFNDYSHRKIHFRDSQGRIRKNNKITITKRLELVEKMHELNKRGK